MANSNDVAALAGTSQSTVSRVFRGVSGVRPEIVRRVREAAKKLNYEPNEAARALTAGRTHRIALVVESLRRPAFAIIADLVHQELVSRGYRAYIIESDSPRGELQEFSLGVFNGVDGVIVCSASRDFAAVDLFRQSRKPLIFALRVGWPLAEEAPAAAVLPDHALGAELAIDHLWGHGHRRIALVGASQAYTAGFETARSFTSVMARRGVPQDDLLISKGPMGYESGRTQAGEFLDSANPPTAFFTPDDQSAYGAVDAARERGIDVPADVSVVGFDDLIMSSWKAYDLTTIAIPFGELVRRTVERVMNAITGQTDPPASLVDFLPVTLITRGSTAPVRPDLE